ncbi:DUF7264 domain-containing protein [Nocardia neocaledoniensis]|uniref:LtfC-like domain-containing protein n=1 Tax=Nocardia neocaledoniensis TaxID=236511 RepID=UPI00245551A6|nr:hypothetical protein [Nocardia neocaledoniensis]
MTSPLITPTPARVLPVSLDADLVVDFRRRAPASTPGGPLGDYLDYPDGVTAKFVIYTDRKDATATRITVAVTPTGSHCPVKVDATQMNAVKSSTLWGFRLIYPDGDLIAGHDRMVVNGIIVRYDGQAATL